MALTVYTVQILVLGAVANGSDIDYPGWPLLLLLLWMLLLTFIGAGLWRYFLGKGPLERVLAALTQAPRPGRLS